MKSIVSALLTVITLISTLLSFDTAAAQTISVGAARKMILQNRERLFKDSSSIRGARIADPKQCRGLGGDCVCVEANAKNSYGGFTGQTAMIFRINGSEIIGLGEVADMAVCGKFSPFPELNGKK